MKTVGQIISQARQKRSLSLEQLSSLTKIDSKYIEALEKDDYQSLPSETFAKGFIRNLCQRLDLNPNELVAIFRRDFKNPEQPVVVKKRHRFVLTDNLTRLFPFVLGGIAFFVYLFFQFRAIVVPPKLAVTRPGDGSVLVSPIEIEGVTVNDGTVYINDETKVRPDSSGHFFARVSLPVGETIIEVKTVNRFSRSTVQKIPITVVSK